MMSVKQLRSITGLSQKAFGEKYHIPKRSIENWEGGQRSPSETIIYLLERAVKEDYNMKYIVIDDCTTKRASIYEELFDSEQAAAQFAESEWSRLTAHDKNNRDAFYLAICSLDDDGGIDWDSIEPIKEYK